MWFELCFHPSHTELVPEGPSISERNNPPHLSLIFVTKAQWFQVTQLSAVSLMLLSGVHSLWNTGVTLTICSNQRNSIQNTMCLIFLDTVGCKYVSLNLQKTHLPGVTHIKHNSDFSYLCNCKFLFCYISWHIDHFHSIPQWLWNGFCYIGSTNKKDLEALKDPIKNFY